MASRPLLRVSVFAIWAVLILPLSVAQTRTDAATGATVVADPTVRGGDAAQGAQAPLAAASAATSNPVAEYKIGPSDLLEIAVFGQPELARAVRVDTTGRISLPLIGALDAVGRTSQQLERLIADRLSENYLQSPQVSVFIKEFTARRFTVEGAVNKPGVFPLVGQMTLLRALATAGGQGALSDVSEVMLFRVQPASGSISLKFDVEKIRAGDTPDPLIQNDDLLVVKRSKTRVALKDSIFRDLLDAIPSISPLRP